MNPPRIRTRSCSHTCHFNRKRKKSVQKTSLHSINKYIVSGIEDANKPVGKQLKTKLSRKSLCACRTLELQKKTPCFRIRTDVVVDRMHQSQEGSGDLLDSKMWGFRSDYPAGTLRSIAVYSKPPVIAKESKTHKVSIQVCHQRCNALGYSSQIAIRAIDNYRIPLRKILKSVTGALKPVIQCEYICDRKNKWVSQNVLILIRFKPSSLSAWRQIMNSSSCPRVTIIRQYASLLLLTIVPINGTDWSHGATPRNDPEDNGSVYRTKEPPDTDCHALKQKHYVRHTRRNSRHGLRGGLSISGIHLIALSVTKWPKLSLSSVAISEQ